MVDFSTQTRVHGYFYTAPERTDPLHSLQEQYRRNEPLVFSEPRVPPHDCRSSVAKEQRDPRFWEAMMFTHGLEKTYQSVDQLHAKEHVSDPLQRPPEKLLYTIGKKGNRKQEFNFPRGVCTDSDGDIIVADTKNHRIQRYNSDGIYKDEFGTKGEFRGEFLNPSDVAALENDDIVIADSGNSRVQIFRPQGRLKHVFNTKAKVVFVAVDHESNVYCSTANRTIEVYDRNRQLICEFPIESSQQNSGALSIAISDNDELIVGDAADNKVKVYSFTGELICDFEPSTEDDSIAVQMSSVAVNPLGHIIVADVLNHVVNQYSNTGVFMAQLLRPTDDLGSVQAITVGPEGHLVAMEYTTNGPHCLKVFRYGSCACHRSRGGSSKRTTPSSTK